MSPVLLAAYGFTTTAAAQIKRDLNKAGIDGLR